MLRLFQNQLLSLGCLMFQKLMDQWLRFAH
uniref:Uncharacterized protein n=1 Tax=Rhizophora mucronata TaxID=61149 RepID=A0A2P2PBW5_RHIMU